MKRIKVFIYEPYIFKVYGNTRYLLSIFKYINSSKFDLTLCALYEHEFLDQIRALGGRCLIAPTDDMLKRFGGAVLSDTLFGKIRMAFVLIQNYTMLYRFLKKESPDIVQCHSIRSLLTIGISARLCGIPCFWYIKGELQNGVLDRIGFLIANRILFQSTINRDRRYVLLRRFFRSKIEINQNGIDLQEINEIADSDKESIRKEFQLREDELKLISIGQVTPLKGVHLLIEALIELKDEMPRYRMFLVGDHVLDKFENFIKSLHHRITESGLSDRIVFTGWRKDATTILSQMDLLVHPSFTEGVPKSVIEAMSLGLPVIITDVGGASELIHNGENGIVINSESISEIKSALRKLISNRALMTQMGAAGKKIAHSRYSIVDNIRRLEDLYVRLAK